MDVNAPEFTSLQQQFGEVSISSGDYAADSNSAVAHDTSHATHSTPSMAFSGIDEASLANYRPDYVFMKYTIADAGSGQPTPLSVTSLAFDTAEGELLWFVLPTTNCELCLELLWQGNAGGHVTSYYSTELTKYTSFQVHQLDDIRHLLTGEFGLLALTKNSLRMYIRRGLPVFTHNSDLLKDMQCMTRLSSGLLIMGGHQEHLIEFDLQRQTKVRVTEIGENGCVIIRNHPKLVCCGDATGKITLRDHSALKVQVSCVDDVADGCY